MADVDNSAEQRQERTLNAQSTHPGRSLRMRLMLAVEDRLARAGLAPKVDRFVRLPVEKRSAMQPSWWMTLPVPAEVTMRTTTLPSRSGELEVRIFRAPSSTPPRAVLLQLHGGGFVAGGITSAEYLCANLALKANVVVAALGYRLSPESRYPAALEDCYDALTWIASPADPLNAKGAPIGVIGDSAGGNLAAALCLLARDERGPAIWKQILIYPSLDATLQSPSVDNRTGGALSREMLTDMLACYIGTADPRDPHISPLLAPDLSRLPPALILTADRDPMRDDGLRYAECLRAHGVCAEVENYLETPHGFFSMSRLSRAAPLGLQRIVDFLGSADEAKLCGAEHPEAGHALIGMPVRVEAQAP